MGVDCASTKGIRRRLVILVVGVLACVGLAAGSAAPVEAATQTIPAGTSATNLPTESVWPGAQSPPYICCWDQQGQYVTFSFTVAAGPTALTLRYSAGNGQATRKLELDGAVVAANEVFPATADWSSWGTVAVGPTLGAGSHTLKVWFDSTAGSANWINLDNLTVSQGAPTVAVSLGYADGPTGPSPWSGAPGTTFIGEPAQCCLTHGPGNGGAGYDAGAIEVANPGSSAVTLSAVTVDFGGGSSPSHLDLWGGGATGRLPQSIPPGGNVVLTMTSGFNFDSSDLLGEACHPNSGVVPVVHVTVDGTTTDYRDDQQILNSDGTDLSSCPLAASEATPFTLVVPGDQPAAPPVSEVPPSIAGVSAVANVLSGFTGGWTASPPPTIAQQWLRCDASGSGCAPIGGATGATYRPDATDAGSTVRFRATGSNASGSTAALSAPSAVVASGPTVLQLGNTSTGFTSVFAGGSTGELDSTFTAASSGTSVDLTFFARGAGNDQTFTPRIYAAANGVKGALLGTGASVVVPRATDGRWYVSALSGLSLVAGASYVLGLAPSGAFNGTYVGAETNGQLSEFVDFTPAASGAPASTSPPTVTGSAQQGATLSASPGTWSGSPSTFTYGWVVCDSAGKNCSAIAKAASSTYVVPASAVGDTLRVVVTAKNAAGSTSATSAQTPVVTRRPKGQG